MNNDHGTGKLWENSLLQTHSISASLLLQVPLRNQTLCISPQDYHMPPSMSSCLDRLPIADQYLPSHRMRCGHNVTSTAPICYAIS